MKTYIYMVRHAESSKTEEDEINRGLTKKGFVDSNRITELLRKEDIDVFVSSSLMIVASNQFKQLCSSFFSRISHCKTYLSPLFSKKRMLVNPLSKTHLGQN